MENQPDNNPQDQNQQQPTPSAQPEVQPQPATPVQSTNVEIPRYPILQSMVGVLRILALIFLVIATIMAMLQFFNEAPFILQLGNFVLFMMLGFFQALMCWTISEGIKALIDIEKQTRTPEMNQEFHKTISVS